MDINVLNKIIVAISGAINFMRGHSSDNKQGADSATEAMRQLEDIKSSVSASNSAGIPALVARAVAVVDTVQKTSGAEGAALLSRVKENLNNSLPAAAVVEVVNQFATPIAVVSGVVDTSKDIVEQSSAAAKVVIGDALTVSPSSSSVYSIPSPKGGGFDSGNPGYSVPNPANTYSIPSPIGGFAPGNASYSVPAPISTYSVPGPVIGTALTVEPDSLANLQPRQMPGAPGMGKKAKEYSVSSVISGSTGGGFPVSTPVPSGTYSIPSPISGGIADEGYGYSIPNPIGGGPTNGSGYSVPAPIAGGQVTGGVSYSVPVPISFYSVPGPSGGYAGGPDVAMFPPPVPPAFSADPGLGSGFGKNSPI